MIAVRFNGATQPRSRFVVAAKHEPLVTPAIAILWQMANEYQAKAARVDGEELIHSRDEITIAH